MLPLNLEEEETQYCTNKQRTYSDNLTDQAGQTISEIGNSVSGRVDVAWDWNLTDLVGFGPVILKISPAGPGADCARRRRLGPARSPLRKVAPPAKPVGF